jgi:hypothetical protein
MKRNALVLTVLIALSSPTFARPPAHDVMPLSFVPNKGQAFPFAQFLARGPGYGLFLSPGEINLVLSAQSEAGPRGESPRTIFVQLAFVDADRRGRFEQGETLPGRVHFLMGNDPAEWQTDLPTFGSVRYTNLYPGIDLVLYGNEGELEYDLLVAPGRDPSVIRWTINGGATPELEPGTGELLLRLGDGALRLKRPYIYQERDGVRTEVSGRYVFQDGAAPKQLAFEIGAYNEDLPLVIDPVLVYSSYIGGGQPTFPFGSASDSVEAVAADRHGFAYVTGRTQSLDFPNTIDPLDNVSGFSDAFVAKVAPDGELVYSTFFGGSRGESGTGIVVDDHGQVVVVGTTSSRSGFPLVNPAQPFYGGSFEDAFVTKLSADGSQFIFSTYLGGSGRRLADSCAADLELGQDIAMDTTGNVYVTGCTCSQNFPTTSGAYSRVKSRGEDAFVTKLDTAGQFVYSTFLGGRFDEEGLGITVDAAGRALVTGEVISDDFPTTADAFQPAIVSAPEAFITRLSPDGSAVEYSTYLGGRGSDGSNAIVLDSVGNIIAVGATASDDFPSIGVPISDCQFGPFAPEVAFVTKIDALTGLPIFSTCLGGTGDDRALAAAIGAYDNIWITGRTDSTDFPITPDALQTTRPGSVSAYVTSLASDGSGLVFSTYLGGSGGDVGIGLAHFPGSVFIGGLTGSTDFPLANPFQGQNAGSADGFVARIEYNEPPSSDAGGPYGVDEGGAVQLTAFGSDPEGSPVAFDWDLDDDGTFETPGESVPFSAANLDGPSSIPISVRVTDDIGLVSISTTTLEVHNVSPTATFTNTSDTQILGATPATAVLAFTNMSDPSAADVASGFLFSYDCDGDMVFDVLQSTSDSLECVYPSAGSFNAVGRIEDKDGGFTDYTVEVEILTPQSAIEGLIDKVDALVEEGKLASSAAQDLLVHLQVALQQLDKDKVEATLRQIRLFISSVERDVRQGRLSPEDGSILIDCANQIIETLGG